MAPPEGWKPVHDQDATFYVPAAWPVERPTAYQFACATFSEPGAFLAPDGYSGGFRCPLAIAPYPDTVHVQPYEEVPVGDTFDINGIEAYHLGDGNGDYLHVALPELRVAVAMYGPDNDLAWKVLRTFQRRQPGNDESSTGQPDLDAAAEMDRTLGPRTGPVGVPMGVPGFDSLSPAAPGST